MAVGSSEKNYFTFVGGLNTEGSALNNPENTADVLENFVVEINGTLRKRPGLSVSGALVADSVGLTTIPIISVHTWVSAVLGVRAEFFVIQVGGTLTVTSIDGSTVTRLGTISLNTYKRSGIASAGAYRISAVSGKSYLYVAAKDIHPFYVKYDAGTNVLIHQQVSIQIRDFYGKEDGLAVDEHPATLSEAHRYNLYNQGWTEDKIQKYNSTLGAYPANSDIWVYGKFVDTSDKDSSFRPKMMANEAFGNSPAPKGHFILNVKDGQLSDVGQLSLVATISKVYVVAVLENIDTHSLIKWSRGSRLSGVVVGDVIKSSDYTGTVVEIGVEAGANYIITESNGLGLDSPGNPFSVGEWEDLEHYRPLSSINVGTSDIFSSETVPSVSAYYAGRVFYAGASSSFWNNAVFYSQLVDKEDKIGRCYQDADPTSEHISDLIATDGGVLFIDSAVDIMAMMVYESSLVIFAANGVWELSGVNDDGFKATSFKLKKISDFGALSAGSVVSTGSGFVFWSSSGIYTLTREEISGSLQAASISSTTIQSFYDAIPGDKKVLAKGFFDEVNKVIYWLYNTDSSTDQPNTSNKILLLDTRISAFYTITFPWEYTPEYGGVVDVIATSNNNILVSDTLNVVVGANTIVVGADQVVVTERSVAASSFTGTPVGILVSRPYGVQLHTLTSPTFYDFGVKPYDATIQTRYDLDGDALRKKHVLYVQPHFKKEIVVPREFTEGSICALPTGWHEVAPMPAARGSTYGVTIGDYFYVFGGSTSKGNVGASNSVYRYNRKTDVWDEPTTMPYAARELTAALLPNGFIYIAGGIDGSSYKNFSYWYDPYNNTWTTKNNLPMYWVDGRIGNLPDGRIIIAGGSVNNNDGDRVTTTYIYDPATDTYTLTGSMLTGVGNHVSATMADGRIIAVAGVLDGNLTSSLKTQIFDPSTMSWSLGADVPFAHNDYPGIAATPCGTVYLWGGGTGPSVFTGIKRVDAYDPSTDTWSTIPDLPFFAQCGAYGRFYDGQYIWASGNDNTSLTPKTYLSTDPVGD